MEHYLHFLNNLLTCTCCWLCVEISFFFILSRHAQRTGTFVPLPSYLRKGSFSAVWNLYVHHSARSKRETSKIQQFYAAQTSFRTEVTPIFTVFNRHPGTSVICVEETDIQPLSKLWYWRRPSGWHLLHREKKDEEREGRDHWGKGRAVGAKLYDCKKRVGSNVLYCYLGHLKPGRFSFGKNITAWRKRVLKVHFFTRKKLLACKCTPHFLWSAFIP